MTTESEKNKYVGSRGTPPPTDPIFCGKVIIDAGNKVQSDYVGKPRPSQNAPDNKEFREKLKAYLSEKLGVSDERFAEIESNEWKIIKQVENNIYYRGGLVDDNVSACACHLGFYTRNAIKK
jgi:hypothetical protein